MRRIFLLISLLAVASVIGSACGNKLPPPYGLNLGPGIQLGAVPTAQNHAGESFTFTATITGAAPFSWSWNFGGGAEPNTASGTTSTSGGTASVTVILVNPSLTEDKSYTGSITATDSAGRSTTRSFDFVVGKTLNRPPTITDISFSGNTLTVTASDPDGDPLTYTATIVSGNVTISGTGPTFTVSATGFGDFPFTVSVTVSDGKGGEDTEEASFVLSLPTPPDNAIWMVLDKTTVSVGDTINVEVWGYNLTNAFKQVSVHIQWDNNIDMVAGSFDVGVPGGDWAIDGIWDLLENEGGLLPGGALEQFIGPFNVDYTVGGQSFTNKRYMQAGIAPFPAQEGVDITPIPAGSTGVIFNFQFEAKSAGTATIKFIRTKDKEGGGTEDVTWYGLSASQANFFDDSQEVTVTVQ